MTTDNVRKEITELNLQQLLEQLQSCDESERIEAKESKAMLGASASETISAFSNEPDLGGGYLILGLNGSSEELTPYVRGWMQYLRGSRVCRMI